MKTITARNRFDEPITAKTLKEAITRGQERAKHGLQATRVQYEPRFKSILIGFVDQSAILLPIQNYAELATLAKEELDQLSIGFGGSALCLEAKDLHVSIVGLVKASQPLTELATTVTASHNGSRTSKIKAAASKSNGLKGGRPKKSAAVT